MSRDNLDDVLEHENLENIEIEDLQVVDEDDEIVFSIEEVEIKDMDKLKNLEDDSEDSEGADLFSLSSEFSINDDFGEINDNNLIPDENHTKKQDNGGPQTLFRDLPKCSNIGNFFWPSNAWCHRNQRLTD